MTQQEIQERNKQIALMLGWIYNSFNDRWNEDMLHDYSFIRMDELKFHSDWNWLMEAVEFIEKIADWSLECLHKDDKVIFQVRVSLRNINIVLENKKEAVFIAVSDFAKLYNEKKI